MEPVGGEKRVKERGQQEVVSKNPSVSIALHINSFRSGDRKNRVKFLIYFLNKRFIYFFIIYYYGRYCYY